MLGTSRASLARLSDGLDRRRGEAGFSAVTEDLFAVADLLGKSKSLRQALSDSGRPSAARADLVRSVLAGQVGEPALSVVAEAVSERWSADADLVTALRALAAQAAFTQAQDAGTLDAVESDLFHVGRVIAGSPALQQALTDPAVPASAKAGLVEDLLAGKIDPLAAKVLRFDLSHLDGRRVDTALDDLIDLAAKQHGRQVAEVRVAAPLSGELAERMRTALERLQGHPVRLNVIVDPTILGGAIVTVGDHVIDGTIASRLEQAKHTLVGTP